MIKIQDIKLITEQAQNQDKVEIWWSLSENKLNEALMQQAKLGKCYLTIGQGLLKWMSVPAFREKVKVELEENEYKVTELGGNCIQISWS